MIFLNECLLIAVLNKGQAENFVSLARSCNAGGSTVYPARGSANSAILCALGLGDIAKEVVYTLAEKSVIERIKTEVRNKSAFRGIILVLGDSNMKSDWKLISVIANAGFADDIMDACRKAGAGGGTIIRARGTANGKDSSFLGITVVPEKEIVMTVVPAEKANEIASVISALPCLQDKGVGIMYIQDVVDFTTLGSKK